MSFWVLLDKKLEKTIVIFGISTLKFSEMQKIVQNKKKNNFRTQSALFEYFEQ